MLFSEKLFMANLYLRGGLNFPDYSKISPFIENSTTETSKTVSEDGWIFCFMQLDNNTTRTVKIDGQVVCQITSGAEYLNGNEMGGGYPVKKGMVVSATRVTVKFCPFA